MSPPRVASLIPSGTEIVAALGFADLLVGRSHCCDHPPGVAALPVLSEPKVDPAAPGADIDRDVRALLGSGLSVYRVLVDRLEAVRADVVVTQDHCDACAVSLRDVEDALAGLGGVPGDPAGCRAPPGAVLCTLHPHDLDAVAGDFVRVASALGSRARGEVVAARFRARLEALRARTAGAARRPRVALVEWLAPPMVAGGWMPELARIAGAEPVLVDDATHFLQVDWETVAAADPEVVVFLPCGFDVPRTRRELAAPEVEGPARDLVRAAPGGAWIVDGDAYFNRPGPRLADSAELLAALLHPGRAPRPRDAFAGSWARWP